MFRKLLEFAVLICLCVYLWYGWLALSLFDKFGEDLYAPNTVGTTQEDETVTSASTPSTNAEIIDVSDEFDMITIAMLLDST